MLDMDGHFLSHLLTKSQYMDRPLGLSYVINTDRLWVGSAVDHMMSVYSSITRQDDVIGKYYLTEIHDFYFDHQLRSYKRKKHRYFATLL